MTYLLGCQLPGTHYEPGMILRGLEILSFSHHTTQMKWHCWLLLQVRRVRLRNELGDMPKITQLANISVGILTQDPAASKACAKN